MPHFRNEITEESLAKVRRLVALATALDEDTSSNVLFESAGIERHTGIGVLSALDVEGITHAVSSGRRGLRWRRGERAPDLKPPKIMDRQRYKVLVQVLKACSASHITTDRLMELAFFSNSARREILGALKAEVVLGNVEWRNYKNPEANYESPSAIEWRWIGPGGKGSPYVPGMFGTDSLPAALDAPVLGPDGQPIPGATPLDKQLAEEYARWDDFDR
jgi:hypothetical protein